MRLFPLERCRESLKLSLVLILMLQLMACAATNSPKKKNALNAPSTIVIGQTTQTQVQDLFGTADEQHTDEDQSEIWIYIYRVNIPFLVSLIPIVGDVADAVNMAHKDREVIVQFDKDGIVKKYKVRPLEQ